MLGNEDLEVCLCCVEGWLDVYFNDVGLLFVLGCLCVKFKLWGKVCKYLEWLIVLVFSVGVWEVLVDMWIG